MPITKEEYDKKLDEVDRKIIGKDEFFLWAYENEEDVIRYTKGSMSKKALKGAFATYRMMSGKRKKDR
jgi:hypothetical protein